MNCYSRILVTGATGFLGRHVCKTLRNAGYESVIAHQGTCDIDLRNSISAYTYIAQMNPDVLIHLAARVGGIGANQKTPGTFFFDNMQMGLNVVHSSKLCGVKKLIMTGTVCAYPKFTPVPFQENNLWDGYPEETNAAYGIAKKALMEMLKAYRQQYGFNGVTLLPVNMYGPHDDFDLDTSHVIPAIIRKIYNAMYHQQDHVFLWGTGRASREFLYVEDCAHAIVKAMELYDRSDPVNLGTGKEIFIYELADMVAKKMGFGGEIKWDTTKPDGQPRRCLDVHLAKDAFGFESTTSLSEGLDKTIDWFKNEAMK